jgi:hypothetical protein
MVTLSSRMFSAFSSDSDLPKLSPEPWKTPTRATNFLTTNNTAQSVFF